jgi:parallel beta-helix repeat protein
VIIDKTITLQGEDRDTTIIDGGRDTDVVKITADQVNVNGFTMANGGGRWGDAGIEISSSDNCEIEDCIIYNNYHGILLDPSSNNNSISNNEITKNTKGIWLDRHSNYNTISNNIASENSEGIVIDISNDNTVSDNIVSGNTYGGINLHEFSFNNTVSVNVVSTNNIGIHFFLSANNNTIKSNWISNNYKGIDFASSNDNIVHSNNIIENQLGLAIDEGSIGNIIYHNDFVTNDEQASCSSSSGSPKNPFHSSDLLEGNYWSDYSGLDDGSGKDLFGEPRQPRDGIGDTGTPHLDIDWYPLMTSRSLTGRIDLYLQDLPEDTFKNNPAQRKNALHNKLLEVQELIENGEYQEAIDKLTHDIMAKMDGDLKNDWITDEDEQSELCEIIGELIKNLGILI